MKATKGLSIIFCFLMVFSTTFFGCDNVPAQPIPSLPAFDVEFDYDNMVFDDFTNGINPDLWEIAHQSWGVNNGGVIKENVSYTEDGNLVLAATGNYYRGENKGIGDRVDGTKTGASLISKFIAKSGRYEIRMKPHPRLGAVSAMWTYAYKDGINDEIDIEIPYHDAGGYTFKTYITTSWRNELSPETYVVNTEPLNDGQWRTFGFDWYANDERIVYYLDGERLPDEGNVFVPRLESRLWVGVWCPNGWGEGNFETDNMYVDWVRYIPFKNQEMDAFNPSVGRVAAKSEFPSRPTAVAPVNKIADSEFNAERKVVDTLNAWKFSKRISAVGDVADLARIEAGLGKDGTAGLEIKDGGLCDQYIDSVYDNYKYRFSFDAKTVGGACRASIIFYGISEISSQTIDIDSADFASFSKDVVAPAGTTRIRLRFESNIGQTMYVDNVCATYLGVA